MALELSMAAPTSTASASTTGPPAVATGAQSEVPGSNFLDSAFVSQLLESVDVDQNDPLFQAALAQINQAGATGGDDKSGEGAEEDKNNRKRKGDDGA